MSGTKKYKLVLFTLLLLVLAGCKGQSIALKKDYKIKSGKDIVFYTATDLHYLSKSLIDNGEAFNKFISSGDGKQLKYMDEILDAFTSNIKRAVPDVLIISGDLTNHGEKQSHLDLAQKLKTIEESGTSVYVIPGNHDILNPYARAFKGDKQYVTDYINYKDFSKIYADFGYEEAISKDDDSLSYLAAPSEDLWFLMLDTNKYKDNITLRSPQLEGELSQDTLSWIIKCSTLAEENGASIVTVMHHNILDHSEVIREGFTLDNNEEALKVFKDNNLNLVLSGHIHIQDICSDNNETSSIYDIASNSLAIYPHQYGILKYSSQDNSIDYNTARVDVEGWAKDKGIADENLNNFKKYSEAYFGRFAYDMASRQFAKASNYSENQIKSMSEIMRTLNLRYFAGTENLNSKDVVNSEGFKLLLNSPESFLKSYANSIVSDKNLDDNSLHMIINNKSPKESK
jgi:3',5'-cyclic AMP phosphodiesterase CpdA